jgi:hypothetical protein
VSDRFGIFTPDPLWSSVLPEDRPTTPRPRNPESAGSATAIRAVKRGLWFVLGAVLWILVAVYVPWVDAVLYGFLGLGALAGALSWTGIAIDVVLAAVCFAIAAVLLRARRSFESRDHEEPT